MGDEISDREYFFNRRTDKTIFSRSFQDQKGRNLRIVSKIVDGAVGLQFASVEDEIVLRQTPAGRYEIKATVLEDERAIKTLTIQRYTSRFGSRQSFSFVGDEIDRLLEFVAGIKAVPLADGSKMHVPDELLRDVVLSHVQARHIFNTHEAMFLEIAQSEDLKRDLVAVGYRRKQIERFELLLSDSHYFSEERERLNTSPEGVWQNFFEANTWIFGYGLSFQFLSGLDDRKLEQVVCGADISGEGKRADAVMKTRGIISSLCFVEIKRHDTSLLEAKPYRSGAWKPSGELVGGVTQVQTTVQDAIENLGRKLLPENEFGDPTGEVLFNVEPRSCLIVGSLAQFGTQFGVSETKFRSFELYRRNLKRPEILTFDELLQRARFIVSSDDIRTDLPVTRAAD